MTTDRSQLKSRIIPKIVLGDGQPGSLSGPPPPLTQTTPQARALERFSVTGNVIVTGGTGDIGQAVCRALLEHGAGGLVMFDVDRSRGVAAAMGLAADFPDAKVEFARVDVTDAETVGEAVRGAARRLGSVDVLVCLAGIVGSVPAVDMTPEQFRLMVDVHLTGSFLCAQAVAREMIRQGTRGSIIMTGSVSGHRPNYPQPQVHYNVAKAGVLAMKDSLAAEWGVHGIRVNTISPGYMNTILNEGAMLDWHKTQWFHKHPMGRMGEPEELVGAIILLASGASTYLTGEDIRIDGGQTLLM